MKLKTRKELLEIGRRNVEQGVLLRQFVPAGFRGLAGDIARTYEEDYQTSDGIVIARINTVDEDRHETIVDPRGADVDAFSMNPVVLYQHGTDLYGDMPIGVVDELSMGDAAIDAAVRFDLADDFAAKVYGKYARGIMRAFSIGFIATDYDTVQVGARNDPRGIREILRYTSWELIELSAVATPSNRQALAHPLSG